MTDRINQSRFQKFVWTDPGWFIYQLEVRIWLWSLAERPPTFLYLSFSICILVLYGEQIPLSFLNQRSPQSLLSPPPPPNGLEINKLPDAWGFTVCQWSEFQNQFFTYRILSRIKPCVHVHIITVLTVFQLLCWYSRPRRLLEFYPNMRALH